MLRYDNYIGGKSHLHYLLTGSVLVKRCLGNSSRGGISCVVPMCVGLSCGWVGAPMCV